MSNIKEVCRLSGVSTATVNRTLRHPELVKPGTREKVMKAVKETGYRPNWMATRFKRGKSNTIVVVVPNLLNPFFMQIIEGIEYGARQLGYNVLLGDSAGDPEIEHQYAAMALNGRADGLIQLNHTFPFSPEDEELGLNVPMISVCDRITDHKFPFIELDNFGAARAMTQHLIELGHSKIGIISGQRKSQVYLDRLSGVIRALSEEDILFNNDWLVGDGYSYDTGVEGIKQLMALDSRPTAVICFSDHVTIGAIHSAKELGLKVPDDISISGFDDITVAQYIDPPITTVRQPAFDIGNKAINNLVNIIDHNPSPRLRDVFPYELIIRKSTGKVKENVPSAMKK